MASFKALTLLIVAVLHFVVCQNDAGQFPQPVTVALNKPVFASSTCGVQMAEDYCEYTTDSSDSLAPNCISTTCNDTCTYSSRSPLPILLTQFGTFGSGASVAPTETGPSNSDVYQFVDSFISISSSNVSQINPQNGFSFAAWVKQNTGNTGALISKSISDGTDRTYAIAITETSLNFYYHPSTLVSGFTTLTVTTSLPANVWHHIAVTVYRDDFALYVNGSVVNATGLVSSIVESTNTIYLGQIAPGIGHYDGLMQDIYYYSQALTEREVEEIATNNFPFLHLSSNCHCPPSHPVASTINNDRCNQHTGVSTSRGSVLRINSNSYTAGYANDNVYATSWISGINQKEVNFTISLVSGSQSAYEIIFVFINYGAPAPKAAILQKSIDKGQTFSPLQYFADDCQFYFGLNNNEPLSSSSDVNCITTFSSQTPLTGVTAQVRFLDANVRPGNINTDSALRSFLTADSLQITLLDFFTSNTTSGHRYYDIVEIIIAGRCACNGHAPRCSNDLQSLCECVHNTQGDRCNECQPLYNDKPWRSGTLEEGASPCKLCNCNNHATSCYYNSSLDPFPDSHDSGGGGVCVNCQDNTDGNNCESCADGYYRQAGVSQSDVNPCTSCDCNSIGSTGTVCVKSEGIPGQIVGQCPCKSNVIGRACDECDSGFFNLTSEGCQTCNCNTDGTVGGSQTCNSQTGQCSCKLNVEGLKCDRCVNGTRGLSASDPNGCSICNCNSMGSVDNDCDQLTGQCTCKTGVTGLNCDTCSSGFYNFSSNGCQSCSCSNTGSANSSCDSNGECHCLTGFTGNKCDTCASGYYNYTGGCTSCNCNSAGSTNTLQCNTTDGQCTCKTNVQGKTCDACMDGFTNLQSTNTLGCSPCDCILGNVDTPSCDPISSQCSCLSHASGLRCDNCAEGYYPLSNGTCSPCDCNVQGSLNASCTNSGQCYCSLASGLNCDTCAVGQYGFPNCQGCQCNSSGSIDSVCNVTTGTCYCKDYVTGMNCDTCLSGYQQLQADNPFGCTKTPENQGPPVLTSRTSVSIQISWSPPSQPNGVIELYRLYRNGILFTSVPRSTTTFNDTGLSPNTQYSYEVESTNIVGSARSNELIATTLESVPEEINPPSLTVINATSVRAQWQAPNISNGVITEYRLNLVAIDGSLLNTPLNTFTGLTFSAVIGSLEPFSLNAFVLEACTSVGCSSSVSVSIRTDEEAPAFQSPPNVESLNSSSFLISWSPPNQPNGIIVRYELYQRASPFTGSGTLINTLSSDTVSVVVSGLEPFSLYEFSVIAYTSAGGRQSDWTRARTDEQEPQGVIDPTVIALSSSAIQITWYAPTIPNGNITQYRIYLQYSNGSIMSLINSTNIGSYNVTGLTPFTQYLFYVTVCNGAGCASSNTVVQTTLESVPRGLGAPLISNITDTSVMLSWSSPTYPNGMITSYNITRLRLGLLPAPLNRDLGISFYGTGHVSFPPITGFSGSTTSFSLMFKTSQPNGLLVYFIDSSTTDLFAIELRNGLPWFIFDAGTGPAAITLNDSSIMFNDSAWHHLSVSKDGTDGVLTVDGIHTGNGSSLGTNRFLGDPVAVYFGGIPSDALKMSQSGHLNSNATIIGRNFAGCIYDVKVSNTPIDFNSQLINSNNNVGTGCPLSLDKGVSFIGGGYIMAPSFTSPGSNSFTLSITFRTQSPSGLLLFSYTQGNGSSYLMLSLKDSNIVLRMKDASTGNIIELSTSTLSFSEPLCNGQWRTLQITKESDGVILEVGALSVSKAFPSLRLDLTSNLLLGGLPPEGHEAHLYIGSNVNSFSGCLRDINFNGQMINLNNYLTQKHVRYFGCEYSTVSTPSCQDQSMTTLVGNQITTFSDSPINPFTEYIYRVSASNSAGSTYSQWTATVTEESVPRGVSEVTVSERTSSSLTVAWNRPTQPNGLIVSYQITAVPIQSTGLDSPLGSTASVTVNITEPSQSLTGLITELYPSTNYSLTLIASTSVGSSLEGSVSYYTTLEDVPIGVQLPVVTSRTSTSFVFTITPPTQPNGLVTSYRIYINNDILTSTDLSITASNLSPFTSYNYHLEACTSIGCANSSIGSNMTLSAPPLGLSPPSLSQLSPTSIEATWNEPSLPNGVISRYELIQISDNNIETIIFNGSGLQTTITGLSPNTEYSFKVTAYNMAGSISSDVSNIVTPEGVPDQISTPNVTVVNSTSLYVTWQEPGLPNGNILNYTLLLDRQPVFTGLVLQYTLTNLQPFTQYSLSVQSCTIQGCGNSMQTSAQTSEATPEGYIDPTVTDISHDYIRVAINEVSKPNGVVHYVLSVTGEFLLVAAGNGSQLRQTVTETRMAYNGSITGSQLVMISDLAPFTQYELVLSVVNSAGTLLGDPFTVNTSSSVPELQGAPLLDLMSSTSIKITWSTPTYPNGLLTSYRINVKLIVTSSDLTLTVSPDVTTALVENLSPYTNYSVTVTAINDIGSVESTPSFITTGEIAPSVYDQVTVLSKASDSFYISWDPPSNPNGVILNYTVMIGSVSIATVSEDTYRYNITGLEPFTEYNISVIACNSAGCVTTDPIVTDRTGEAAPEGVPSPDLFATTSGSVIITWTSPSSPNGLIQSYTIYKALQNDQFSSLATVPASSMRRYNDSDVVPFTQYEYFIEATNNAGSTSGDPMTISTSEAAPQGVLEPELLPLSSSSIHITIYRPLTPNGIITEYTLTRTSSHDPTPGVTLTLPPSQVTNITYTDTGLSPFTNYTYILTACTGVGCTNSQSSSEVTFEAPPTGVTPPSIVLQDDFTITISWVSPSQPNGIITNYTLVRADVGFTDTEVPNCCQSANIAAQPSCTIVYQTHPLTNTYTDSGLYPYSYYQYCILVTNGAGSVGSNHSASLRTGVSYQPLNGPNITTAVALNATALYIEWSQPGVDQLLGPLVDYTLQYREGDDGERMVVYNINTEDYTIVGLTPSTSYTISVNASNGRGTAPGPEVTVMTRDGIPSGLSSPLVFPDTSTSLIITFNEPDHPNGIITLYSILLDSVVIHNETSPGSYRVTGLSPYTVYTAQIIVCTSYGCNESDLTSNRTLESAPTGFASPIVTVRDPYSVVVTWSHPNKENGVITNYLVYVRETISCPPEATPPCYNSTLITTLDSSTLNYTIFDLSPATQYGFAITAVNNGGSTSSGFTMATTDEAPPSFVTTPIITSSSSQLDITWTPPTQPNGIIISYTLYRDDNITFGPSMSLMYTDTQLTPYTSYDYILQVCTNGGCTNSSVASGRTLEATPTGFGDLLITNIQDTTLDVTWIMPTNPNGIIRYYEVYFGNDTLLANTTFTSFTVTGLTSFTNYSFYVTACNNAGCAISDTIYVLTNESLPMGVAITSFAALAFDSIEIVWSQPTHPNGIILYYVLFRGSQSIFQGQTFQFVDTNLEGGVSYTYSVQAVNSAGATTSNPISVTTPTSSPTGISAPVLTVLSATEIFVQWSEPNKANGIISSYRVYVNNTLSFQDLVFNHTLTNLLPYTSYTIRIEVCTVQNDCGNSPSVTNTTEQARPTGISPPVVMATSHSSVSVSWTVPTAPNGIIRFYRVMRRLADNILINIFAYAGGPNVFTFTDRNLLAYTRYEYQLVVINDAGSSISQWVQVTTLEDVPASVSAPSFATITPYNVTVTWEAPLSPNGIINRYQIFYRLLVGDFMLGADVSGNITEATVTGLQPHSAYDFKIRAHNSAGFGDSPVQAVFTSEAPPQMLRLISLISKTSESLTLTWLPPLQPNGVISEYALYLNGTEEYRDSATTYTITRLKPYTGYSIRLEACTNAGCTLGHTQGFTTSESFPVGQPAPVFTTITSRSVLVTWGSPLQPNGIILSYEVFRMQVPEPLLVNGTDGALLIHLTNDVATRRYNDTSLSPNTGYQYALRANNSIGYSTSSFVYVMTSEDAPEGVPSPTVHTLSTSQLQISWDTPGLPNGVITLYQVYRLDPNNVSSIEYSGMNRFFVDDSLSPYTLYRYTVQACTQAGCTNGSVGFNTTEQSIPQGFDVLELTALSNSIVSATWEAPTQPNGVLIPYIASIISPINVTIPTNELTVSFNNLQPFTQYTITVQSCTIIGCISVGPDTVRTLESIPFLLSAPLVAAISPTSVSATWFPPAKPNGIIIRYLLRRNDTIIYDGSNTSYVDSGLAPSSPYAYDVQAFTSVGGGDRSSVVMVTTQSDTPTDVDPPSLSALDSTSVLANWNAPGTPNGVITKYILYQLLNGNESVVYMGTAMSFAIHNLNIFTEYMYRVEACTTTCGSSVYSTVTTLEAPPTGQAPPTLLAYTNETIFVSWDPPLFSNGIIQSYSLERRQVLNGLFGSVVTVASPLSSSTRYFYDSADLLEPALTFQYRVGVANSVGSVTSGYSTVTLPDAPPEGVANPVLINKTSLSFAVSVTPPTKPNGQITLYTLYSTSFEAISLLPDSQSDSVIFHVSNLNPFTTYTIHADTCTSAGCTSSSNIAITTDQDTPTGLAPPLPTVTSSTGIRLDWSPPVRPNGIITSYSLWYKLPCPQPQVFPVPLSCSETDYQYFASTSQLTYDFVRTADSDASTHPFPYTSYQFLLQAENIAGAVNSTDSTIVTTINDVPQVTGTVSFTIYTSNQSVALNWTDTFRLNGVLRHFVVIRDGFFLLQGTQTSAIFGNQPIGRALQFSVKAVTETGEVTTPSYPLFISGPSTNDSSTTSTSVAPTVSVTDPPQADSPFYEQFPFIVGIVIVVILLCFVCFLVLLCFVRPKRKGAAEKYDVSTLKSQGSPVRNDGTVRASWIEPRITPIPSYHDVGGTHSSTRLKHSSAYSPSKVALLSQDYSGGDIPLQDTHITRLSKTDLLPPAESVLGPPPPPFVEDEEFAQDERGQPSSSRGHDTPNSVISNSPSPPPPPVFSQSTDDENALLDTKI